MTDIKKNQSINHMVFYMLFRQVYMKLIIPLAVFVCNMQQAVIEVTVDDPWPCRLEAGVNLTFMLYLIFKFVCSVNTIQNTEILSELHWFAFYGLNLS